MINYEELYYALFNELTDICELMEDHKYDIAVLRIEAVQKAAEKRFVEAKETPRPRLLVFPGGKPV